MPKVVSGDLVWVVRKWCFAVEPPIEHFRCCSSPRPRGATAMTLSCELMPTSRLLILDVRAFIYCRIRGLFLG